MQHVTDQHIMYSYCKGLYSLLFNSKVADMYKELEMATM